MPWKEPCAGKPAGRQDDPRWLARDGGSRPEPELAQHRRRILLAMADAPTRRALAELLAMEGHEVREATDGAATLQLVAGERPDVVVADAYLPGIDGPALAARLREWGVPVVLLGPAETAAPREGVVCLPKPIDVTRLLAVIAPFPAGPTG